MIQLKHVKKIYGSGENSCNALKDISFEVNTGEFIALCGTSGSGKTTLFNIISGIDRNYEGKCYIDNTNLSELTNNEMTIFRRMHIGIIFQFFNLVSSLTVKENITLVSQLKGEKVSNDRLDSILNYLNLENKKNSFIHELSGGQQQRVAIARTMYSETDIILADEPTGNLDSENTKIIMDILLNMKGQNKTVIVITHDNKIAKLADRIINIKDGLIIDEKY